jgi:hypothetical protein
MLWGSVEVLLGLKNKMLVNIPALEAEMRGLRNGMEWEKMKQQMASLRSELTNTKARLARVEGRVEESSSSEEEEVGDDHAASMVNMPSSSMYIPPSQLHQSRWSPLPVVRSSSNIGNGNNVPVPMAIDLPVPPSTITNLAPPNMSTTANNID